MIGWQLVDLAAVLDFVGMMNQTQYHDALEGLEQKGGGFKGESAFFGV